MSTIPPCSNVSVCQDSEDIGEKAQEKALLKWFQDIKTKSCDDTTSIDTQGTILGVRIIYNLPKSDHAHNEHWTETLSDTTCRECGTITKFDFSDRATITVLWDCGAEKDYPYSLWSNLTVFTLGPAGK